MTEKFNRQDEVFYNGQWVPKKFFRAFVYKDGAKVLAETHEDYVRLKSQGYGDDDLSVTSYAQNEEIDETTLDDLQYINENENGLQDSPNVNETDESLAAKSQRRKRTSNLLKSSGNIGG